MEELGGGVKGRSAAPLTSAVAPERRGLVMMQEQEAE